MATIDNETEKVGRQEESKITSHSGKVEVIYSINSNPPWHLSILLGLQHYLTACGSLISLPVIISKYLCVDDDLLGLSQIISTQMLVSGLSTLLQTTLGVRLPIVQGTTASFIVPTVAILVQDKWKCPHTAARQTQGADVNFTAIGLPEIGSEEHQQMWHLRMREIQGAIMMAALMQMVIGFSGMVGFALRYIGPLSITPTIALIGLSLFNVGSGLASQQWWIAIMTMFLITLFSQYLKNVRVKFIRGSTFALPVFNLFPVLMAIMISWLVCYILTLTDALPNKPGSWGYLARTDRNTEVLIQAPWFRVPYPGQWGIPTVSVSSAIVMIAAVLASVVESIGDYYACARLSGAPPPPLHAVNRGIGIEGLGCLIAGAWGTGNATTSFSQNVGTIGITKVGSRRVVQVGGVIMLILGCLTKFGALFASIPGPVIGGTLMISFGMVTAVGLSNLQYVNMNSSRNIFILGVSLYFGLSLPKWMEVNKEAIKTGNDMADQILTVLCSTSLFVGGITGFVLDNTIPGTDEERGILKWREETLAADDKDDNNSDGMKNVYDIPMIQKYLDKVHMFKYIPFCPAFMAKNNKSLNTYDNCSVNDDITGNDVSNESNDGRAENVV